MTYRFHAEVWRYPGESAWHFITVPAHYAEDIRDLTSEQRRGFGSVRVVATIGSSTWATSIFPEKSSGSYILPVKKAVRTAQGLDDGAPTEVTLELV